MQIGKRFLRLINGEVVFGECETIDTEGGAVELLIKTPYTAKSQNIMPYMADIMSEAPAAVQIHPMNILWQCPLDEFPTANEVYTKATETASGLILPNDKLVI